MKKFLTINQKTFEDYGVTTHEELWNKVKATHKGLAIELPVEFEKTVVKGADDKDEEVYTMVMSDDKEDRHGDFVMQNFDLKDFKKNPVLLDSHNYSSITHIIGSIKNVRVEDNKLKGELQFSKANPKGVLAQAMVAEGTLSAGSIGFIPDGFDAKGRITKSIMLEYSMVSVPANPRSLLEKAIDEIVEEAIDEVVEVKHIETATVFDNRKALLNSIAKAVQDIEVRNLAKHKVKILQSIRQLK
jgi:phage head maturation protease